MKLITNYFATALLFVLLGCERQIINEATTQDTSEMELDFSKIQKQVFTPRCATSGCHKGLMSAMGLDLSLGNAYQNIVNVNSREMPSLKLILPGNSADSYLIRKIRGQNILGRMAPCGRPPLSNSMINATGEWVDRGALYH